MACYHPLDAWRTRGGDITFRQGQGFGSILKLPCGQCIGCRLERSRQWAMRCLYESQLHEDNAFVTFTYSDDFLPADRSLCKRHFQLFIKSLRKRFIDTHSVINSKGQRVSTIRYFQCGEYGESFGRPHYHAILFGIDFHDKRLYSERKDVRLYSSELLDSLWGLGSCTFGAVTFESAAYVARYCLKKRTGPGADKYYERIVPETGEIVNLLPEYVTMSLKPAIGKGWYEKFCSDVFPSDFLVVRGQRVRPPRYFDKLLDSVSPSQLEAIKLKRIRAASKFKADGTPERLAVRSKVATARSSLSIRHKDI